MDGDILISSNNLMRALTLWDRKYRNSLKTGSHEFVDFAENLVNGNPEQYGQDCAPYFRSLLIETR